MAESNSDQKKYEFSTVGQRVSNRRAGLCIMSRFELECAMEALYSGDYCTGLSQVEALLALLPPQPSRLRSDALRLRADALKVLEKVRISFAISLFLFSFFLLSGLSVGLPCSTKRRWKPTKLRGRLSRRYQVPRRGSWGCCWARGEMCTFD